MVGINLALASGLHRRYGWPIVSVAAFTSALPDWDGLSILFGGEAYARAHRVWGHNLLVAAGSGAAVAMLAYGLDLRGYFTKIADRFRRGAPASDKLTRARPPAFCFVDLVIWLSVGIISSLSHLAVDLFYSFHAQLTPWPLPLLWPFSDRTWVFPAVAYGDLGATAIFIIEMFCLVRWPARAQFIAWISLSLVAAYIVIRWGLVLNSVPPGYS
jgi:membrane-bound metal-dependent hydrolase YbcI (DUF457 family)